MDKKGWFIIDGNGARRDFDKWIEAKLAWNDTTSGYLCRLNGTLLDCK